jgi:hypothetical protein
MRVVSCRCPQGLRARAVCAVSPPSKRWLSRSSRQYSQWHEVSHQLDPRIRTRLPPASTDSGAEREEAKSESDFGQIRGTRIGFVTELGKGRFSEINAIGFVPIPTFRAQVSSVAFSLSSMTSVKRCDFEFSGIFAVYPRPDSPIRPRRSDPSDREAVDHYPEPGKEIL